jgi:Tubulin like
MNHLLIGLGGTGGKVLRSFRKLSFQTYRGEPPPGTVIDYLFVDSDPKSFREDDPSWTVLGRSVGLSKRNQLPIQQADLRAVIENLNSHPNLKPWIGDRKAWGELLAGLDIDAAGGQKRRLGRFLFAMSARRFKDSVSTLVREMQDLGRTAETTFHIFTGLAGGTGSGSVVDVVAQLRKLFPDKKQRIIVYAYLPDLNPPSNWNTGNYHANAYAALMELNAMSAGAWSPYDVIDGTVQPRDFWFNGCYVFTDENDQGFRASIEGELTDILADFVFHKIVVAGKVAWEDLPRFENSENGDAAAEALAGTGKGQRAVRFMSFGIRRISFPEESIREYLTYDFVAQSLRQLQHNNWLDGLGFSDQARPRTDAEFVASAKQRDAWCLTDEHLRLIRPIIETEASRKWKPIEQEWQDWETHYLSLARQQAGKVEWLKELKTLFTSAYDQNYRGAGVSQFFATYERDLRSLASAVRDLVERAVFDDWRVGTASLSEASRVVSALLTDLSARRDALDNDIVKREQTAEELFRQFADLERRWPQIGMVGSLLGSYERALTQAAMLLRDRAIANTAIEGLRFAKRLISEISEQLTDLKAAVDSAAANVGNAAEEAMRTMRARSPNRDSGPLLATNSGYVLRLEDSKGIEAVRRKLSLDEKEQHTQTATVRAGIVSALGQQANFKALSSQLAGSGIRNTIIATCEENVESAHQRLIEQRSERVLGVSILQKLQQEWGSNPEKIAREVNALARSAGRFLAFDETEINMHFDGRSGAPRATEAFAVMLPEAPEFKEFVGELKTAFRNARAGQVSFVSTHERGNEISMVTLVNLFPLRFARVVRALRERYHQRIASYGRDRTVLEVHLEGDARGLPDLFIADAGEIRTSARPVILLAVALGILTQAANRSGGKPDWIISRKDDDGFDLPPIVLGTNLDAVIENISERALSELKLSVSQELQTAKGLRDDVVATVRDALQIRMSAIKQQHNDEIQGQEYIAWSDASRHAMKVVRGEVEL